MTMLEGLVSSFEDDEEDRVLTEAELAEKHKACLDLRNALRSEESLWSAKAKAVWQVNGDRCSSYFRRLVAQRCSRNSISHLQIEGQMVLDPDRVRDHLKDFYEQLYTEKQAHKPIPRILELRTLDQAQSARVEEEITEAEIKSALDKLSGDKDPGPDGFPMKFY